MWKAACPKDIGQEGVNWINLARNRDKWRAVVKMLMHIRTL
jgi:hypothetical protein